MQQVKIERAIQFVGSAQNKDNVEGNPSLSKMVIDDDFTQVTLDATNDYTVTVAGTNDAVAISTTPGSGGWISILSGDTDNEACFMATPLIFDISKNPIAETRVYLSTITETAFFFGFSDAILEITPAMPIDDDSATPIAAAEDVAGFVIDADSTTASLIQAGSATTAGAATMTSTGITAVNSTKYVLRVELNSEGDAYFYVNNVLKAIHQTAVSDVPLCVIFAAATRANGAGDAVFADYLKTWQDR